MVTVSLHTSAHIVAQPTAAILLAVILDDYHLTKGLLNSPRPVHPRETTSPTTTAATT